MTTNEDGVEPNDSGNKTELSKLTIDIADDIDNGRTTNQNNKDMDLNQSNTDYKGGDETIVVKLPSITDENNENSMDENISNSERSNQSASFVELSDKQNALPGSGEHVSSEDSKHSDVIQNSVHVENKSTSKTPTTMDDDDDLDEYDPDLHITEEEKKAFEYMIEQKQEEIIKQRDNFQQWVDSITRRRMFALSRMRKITKCHKERMTFYDQINNYVKTAEDVIQTDGNTNFKDLGETSVENESNNQSLKDLVRENTGFTITNQENKDNNITGSNDNSINNDNIITNKKSIESESLNNNLSKTDDLENSKKGNDTIPQNVDDDVKHSLSNIPKIVQVQS